MKERRTDDQVKQLTDLSLGSNASSFCGVVLGQKTSTVTPVLWMDIEAVKAG
jgi:hypothetical protein